MLVRFWYNPFLYTILVVKGLWLNEHHLSCDLSSSENNVQKAPDNATLMGVEGSASRQYLAQWRTLWDEAWGFTERNRRPPLDPVNALLSLSYTLAGNQIGQWATNYGLDLSSRQKFLRAKTFASNLDFCMFP
jgi:CRISPR/Cas system-associated endonuclease Cas1